MVGQRKSINNSTKSSSLDSQSLFFILAVSYSVLTISQPISSSAMKGMIHSLPSPALSYS